LSSLEKGAISQGKEATASSQWSQNYAPAMAFDGDDNTRWVRETLRPLPQIRG